MSVVTQQSGSRRLRRLGYDQRGSKLIAFEILQPTFRILTPVRVICRKAEIRLFKVRPR